MTPSQQRPAKRFFIHAGTFSQAASCAKKNDLSPTQWTYLDKPEKMRGLRASKVVVEETVTYPGDGPNRKFDDVILIECSGAGPKPKAEGSLLLRVVECNKRLLVTTLQNNEQLFHEICIAALHRPGTRSY